MKNKIILKSDTFQYPTKEERREIAKVTPKVNCFKIEYKSSTFEIIKHTNIDDAIRIEDIFWWNNCLENRIKSLAETFVYEMTHFRRHQQNASKSPERDYTNEILLEYYIEIFYYYFFSARDVMGQLLNLVFNLGIKERDVFFSGDFIKKIPSEHAKRVLLIFFEDTFDSYKNRRNSFNHRFTPIHQDNRAQKSMRKVNNTISFYPAAKIDIEEFIQDINALMSYLSKLMFELNDEIKKCS
ncbi:MAG: Cthe_2314 family HEPN domain-containing protein [Sphingobacteriaceae bacterium]